LFFFFATSAVFFLAYLAVKKIKQESETKLGALIFKLSLNIIFFDLF